MKLERLFRHKPFLQLELNFDPMLRMNQQIVLAEEKPV
jgi:hypothetical protein